MLAITAPLPLFVGLDGQPLSGLLYIGTANDNPETSQIPVYWDAAGTQPAAQPLTVSRGVVFRGATPSLVFVSGDFSLSVRDLRGRLVIYAPSAADYAVAQQINSNAADFANEADAAKGANLFGYNPALAYTDGLGQFLNYLHARTANEVSAGVTPTNYAYHELDPRRYGAAGDTNGTTGNGTDDSTAWRNLGLVLQQRGGGVVRGGGKLYRVMSGSTAALLDLSNCRGVHFENCHFFIDRTFTVGQIYQLFQLSACDNVTGAVKVTCSYAGTGSAKFDRGFEVFKVLQGCKNITLDIKASNVRSAFMVRRETSDPTTYVSRNIRVQIDAKDCGYAYNGILSGDNVDAVINTEGCTRSYYVYGVKANRAVVRSKNHEGNANALLSSASGYGLEEIDVTYIDTESTVSDNSVRGVVVSFGDQTPAVMRNIKVRTMVNLGGTYYVGTPFEMEKLDSGGSYDTVDRGHRLEGLEVDFHLKSGSGSQPSLRVCSGGTWGSGEFIDNVSIRLRSDGAGQPTIKLASLLNAAEIRNSYSSAQINLTGNTAGRIMVSNTIATWSIASGSRVAFAEEQSVTVTYSASMTPDASLGSHQVMTVTNGSAFTINAPTNPTLDRMMTVIMRNASGGALGTATWNAVFKMAAWTNPGNGNSRSITFRYDGTNWVEQYRSASDIPN